MGLISVLRRVILGSGRIGDSKFLLQARAAAQRDTAPADHRVTTDVVIRIDENDRRAAIASTNRRAQPGGAGLHDHHIGRSVPLGGAAVACYAATPRAAAAAAVFLTNSLREGSISGVPCFMRPTPQA